MIKRLIKRLWDQLPAQILSLLIYLTFVVVYLLKLHGLNNLLLKTYPSSSPLEIIAHNNNQPLLYIIGAICFYIVGIFLIVYFIKSISEVVLEGTIFLLVSAGIIFICLVLIFGCINNPILKAFLAVLGIGGVAMGAISQS